MWGVKAGTVRVAREVVVKEVARREERVVQGEVEAVQPKGEL